MASVKNTSVVYPSYFLDFLDGDMCHRSNHFARRRGQTDMGRRKHERFIETTILRPIGIVVAEVPFTELPVT